MTACRSCGQPILWATTKLGKKMPVEERVGGNVVLEFGVRASDAPTAIVVQTGTGTHVSHFVTCPQAKGWRGKGSK